MKSPTISDQVRGEQKKRNYLKDLEANVNDIHFLSNWIVCETFTGNFKTLGVVALSAHQIRKTCTYRVYTRYALIANCVYF